MQWLQPYLRWSILRRGGDVATTLIGIAAQVFALVTGLIVLVVTAKALGPEGRGVIATVTTLLTTTTTLAGLSLGQVVIKTAAGADTAVWLPRALGNLLPFTAIATLVGWAAAAAAMASGLSFSRDVPAPLLALGLAALPFGLWEQYGTQILLLLGKAEACSAIIIAARSAYLLMVLALLWSGAGAAGVLLAFAVSQALMAAAQGGILWRAARRRVVRDGALPHLILDGLRVHWRFVGDLLLASASVLMLTMLSGVRESGLFQVALSLIAVPVVVPQAAAMVVTGHVGTLGANASWAKGRRILIGVTGLMIAAAVAAAAMGPFLIVRVLGSEFQESAAIFRMLCPLLVSSAVMRIMSVQWSARGLFKTASAVMLAAGLTNVALVWLLAPRLGMTGAAIGLLAAHALILCVETWLVVRCEREHAAA